ncbi:HAD family hydrolase [Saccharomonospora halophila]|uniref:HAD family hydrolase n=1 Tax=Saccharomonospora halophila TaxID=129922 RepID=UPI00038164E6|nr:HAD-IA family hydrolase [Saccharomonospora halophila]
MNAAKLVTRARHILLDFDGPVCAVFSHLPDHAAADRLRARLAELEQQPLPADVAQAHNPFDVLAHAHTLGRTAALEVETVFREAEVQAVRNAQQAPELCPALQHFAAHDRVVTIVSNNSAAAVEAYLQQEGLSRYVSDIAARTPTDIDRLKPDPHLLHRAMTAHGTSPGECLMIGDSSSDIQAARAAGTAVVAYANKPGKHQRLAAHHPDAIIRDLTELMPNRATT